MDIYQLKITLKHINPAIWRRILVPGSTTLAELHDIIQISMGWFNCHLFGFDVHKKRYDDEAGALSSQLDQLMLAIKDKFTYEYDFGDGWEHEIILEKVFAKTAGTQYPICLAGKRACPPEDCGGPWGYQALLEILDNPSHPDYQDSLAWVDGSFHPEIFDIDRINKRLGTQLMVTAV